tara:strand:- start:1840 stop:4089 length:2250 start_codon:yes stop_codon:yes gene_type:complete
MLKNKFSLFFLSFLFVVLINFASYSKNFNKIIINGNDRISDETIILFSEINEFNSLNEDLLNKILKNLYNTNFFKNVTIRLIEQEVIIDVIELPIIENINLNGVKAKKIRDKIFKNIKLKSRSSFSELSFDQDKKNILNTLKEIGYYFATVSSNVYDLNDNKVRLDYNIVLGKKAKIRKIIFIGDKKIKDNKLKSIIVSEEYKPWKFLSGKKFLNENLILFDQKLLKNFYLNRGYYDIKINSSFAKLRDNNEFELIFNINANKKFFFNELKITFPDDFDANNFNKLNELFDEIKGNHYSLSIVEKILDEINKITLNEEYRSITASVNENIVANKINLNFLIEETEKFLVDKINIKGNNITREEVIRNYLELDEGDPYNEILEKRSVNNIKSLNFFKDVKSEVLDIEEEGKKIINITVEEKATGEIFAGAGVGTNGGTFSFGVSENNYLGKGIKVATNLSISEETVKGSFYVTDPNFRNSDKEVNYNIEATEINRTATSGYKSNKTGLGIGTKFEYLDDFNLGLSTQSLIEKIETDLTASALQKKQKGNYWDTFVNLDFDYDKRNQKFQTSDGFRSSYNINIPLVSEVSTLTNSYFYNYYTELYEDNISKFSLYVKAANSLKNKNVKLSERLYIPNRRLRGFESGKVGPKDGNDFVGGNYITSFSASSSIPKILENSQNLDVLIFYDAASIWGVDYDSTIDDNSKIRSSIGLGIDWFTVIGPLNFSLAQPITKSSTDITETFRFNLGTTF